MARERNRSLWSAWRDRVARYDRCAETSAEFCRREGVSVASLFYRRRRLAFEIRSSESVAAPARQPMTPTFVPVCLPTQDARGVEVGGRLEIELPNGTVVRLTGDAARLLHDAIAASGALPPEASSC